MWKNKDGTPVFRMSPDEAWPLKVGDRFAATCSQAPPEANLRCLRPTGFDQAQKKRAA